MKKVVLGRQGEGRFSAKREVAILLGDERLAKKLRAEGGAYGEPFYVEITEEQAEELQSSGRCPYEIV